MKLCNKKIILILLIVFILIGITGCDYDSTKKSIIQATVLEVKKEKTWYGKFYLDEYYVIFDTGNNNEWKIKNKRLYKSLKKGDVISIFKIDYINDDKIIRSDYELIY